MVHFWSGLDRLNFKIRHRLAYNWIRWAGSYMLVFFDQDLFFVSQIWEGLWQFFDLLLLRLNLHHQFIVLYLCVSDFLQLFRQFLGLGFQFVQQITMVYLQLVIILQNLNSRINWPNSMHVMSPEKFKKSHRISYLFPPFSKKEKNAISLQHAFLVKNVPLRNFFYGISTLRWLI